MTELVAVISGGKFVWQEPCGCYQRPVTVRELTADEIDEILRDLVPGYASGKPINIVHAHD